jgi:ABC-type Na+ efflux pump permease subunit
VYEVFLSYLIPFTFSSHYLSCCWFLPWKRPCLSLSNAEITGVHHHSFCYTETRIMISHLASLILEKVIWYMNGYSNC